MLQSSHERVLGRFHLKSTKILAILTVLTAILLCSGFVSALNSDEAIAHAIFSATPLQAGQPAQVTILFSTTSTDNLTIDYVGINFDWMPSGDFFGYNLTSEPITVLAGGSTVFNQMTIQVPTTAFSGDHTYVIGIDGTQGLSQTPFSWTSSNSTVQVTGGIIATPTPNSGGQPGQADVLLYAAIGAAIIIIALLLMVLLVRRKRAQPTSKAKQDETKPASPSPEKKPSSEQDFSI
jgi:hypothetical protein